MIDIEHKKHINFMVGQMYSSNDDYLKKLYLAFSNVATTLNIFSHEEYVFAFECMLNQMTHRTLMEKK